MPEVADVDLVLLMLVLVLVVVVVVVVVVVEVELPVTCDPEDAVVVVSGFLADVASEELLSSDRARDHLISLRMHF